MFSTNMSALHLVSIPRVSNVLLQIASTQLQSKAQIDHFHQPTQGNKWCESMTAKETLGWSG